MQCWYWNRGAAAMLFLKLAKKKAAAIPHVQTVLRFFIYAV